MNTVISMLLVFAFNSFNKDVYYEIAVYILSHLDQMAHISIENFARDCRTSTVTIKKFCRLLGVDSFKKFKILLANTRAGRLEQIKCRYAQLKEEEMIRQIRCLLSCPDFNSEELLNHLQNVVDMIYEARQIYIAGASYPLALTLNFIEDMLIFGKSIYIEQLGYQADSVTYQKDDLIIFMTMTGRLFCQNKQVFMEMYQNEAKKIMMTQNQEVLSFYHFDEYLPLYGHDDTEALNLVIVEILNLMKYHYFKKYVG